MTSSEYRKLTTLLAGMKSGNRSAFTGIYSMYEKKVYFLCCKILKSKNDAKKLTTDIFDYAYLQISGFSDAAGFDKWLYSTVFSKCRQFLLENRPEVFGDYTDTDSSDGEQIDILLVQDADDIMNYPGGIDISVDMMQTVDTILSDLPQKLRNVVLLHYFCGFDDDEIAKIEQISYASFRNRLYKARIRIGTEEHKYTEIGYGVAGMVTFFPDILSTMADSIVIPGEIASAVTSRTGVNCMSVSGSGDVVISAAAQTAHIKVAQPVKPKSSNYLPTSYAVPEQPKKPASQEISPAVKVLMAIVAILVIIGGTVAVTLAIQGRNKPEVPAGEVENVDNNVVPTTIEMTTKGETTTETTTVITEETTTEAVSVIIPETTTEITTVIPETTTELTTVIQETTTVANVIGGITEITGETTTVADETVVPTTVETTAETTLSPAEYEGGAYMPGIAENEIGE